MLAAFHLNLTALSWIALIVGLFLVYNTVTISVVARREEIGTLRALGVTRRQVLAAVPRRSRRARPWPASRSASALARLLADAAVGLTASTVSTLYIATARGAAGHERRPRRGSPSRSACRCRCSPPRCRRSKPAACRRRRRCAGTTRSRCASRLRPAHADRCRRIVLAVAYGLAQLPPVGRPAAVRLRLVVRDRHRRRAAGAGDHVRPRPRSAARRCAAGSASRACSRTPTSRRRFRGCRSRSRRLPSACR